VKTVMGVLPSTGTFTVFFENEYTSDIAVDASAADVKSALENLATVNKVAVTRDDTSNGYKWTVSFVQNMGNLRMMEASPYRYEIQQIWTSGGSPTPLSGEISISFGGDNVHVPYDATSSELKIALESMPSVGNVEVHSRTILPNGQFSWMITFRGLIGDVVNLQVDDHFLLGSDAAVHIKEIVAGNDATLVGERPTLSVLEKVAGFPSYTANYIVDSPGLYTLQVNQLTQGGLYGNYFDNQWRYGTPQCKEWTQ